MTTIANKLVASSVWVVNQNVDKHPVAIIRKARTFFSKATRYIEIGALKVPLNFKKMESIVAVAPRDEGSTQHPHSVPLDVSWPVAEQEK